MPPFTDFHALWAADFEYSLDANDLPRPFCFVAQELRTGHEIRLWGAELTERRSAPFPVTADTLFVAYATTAELSCFQVLGWEFPRSILDLYVEYRHIGNGRSFPEHFKLASALATFGLDSISAAEKSEMQQLALRGPPFTTQERRDLLDYCASDVHALARLLPAMRPYLDLPRALLRGRYMAAVTRMHHQGIPIDRGVFEGLQSQWESIRKALIDAADPDRQIFTGESFTLSKWSGWCERRNIPWPTTPTGLPSTKGPVFRAMARQYPETTAIADLKATLDQLDSNGLAVFADGRNRAWLNPFGSKTGRNQPSNAKFIFGAASWLRRLIQPPPGHGLGYLDWQAQEIGIVAALSGDKALQDAYASGDPYISFGRAIHLIPPNGTKTTHQKERNLCKTLMLGVNYGMGAKRFAAQAKITIPVAEEILRRHKALYHQYWDWIDMVIDVAYQQGYIETVFGWRLYVKRPKTVRGKRTGTSQTTLQNFPAQANAGEMLRIALCFLTERGVRVCAPVHDALLLEAPLDELEVRVQQARALMEKASRIVLRGFVLRTDATIFQYPEHFSDEKGTRTWEIVSPFLQSTRVGG